MLVFEINLFLDTSNYLRAMHKYDLEILTYGHKPYRSPATDS